MTIHYDSLTAAEQHLARNGWQTGGHAGLWVSRDKTCAASIHPVPGSEAVAVFYRQIA